MRLWEPILVHFPVALRYSAPAAVSTQPLLNRIPDLLLSLDACDPACQTAM